MTVHQLKPRGARPLNYSVKAKADAGEICLYDIIGAGWFGGISATQFAVDLKALGPVKTIDLRINSDGGDVFEGRAIAARLNEHSARIVVHVDGLAASIASIIAMTGDEIRMADGSYMMIHNAAGGCLGGAEDMERMAGLLRSVDGTLVDTYVAHTGNTAAAVQAWMEAETWFTAKEAVANGFADIVDEPVKAAASVRDPAVFRNLPAALRPRRAAALKTIAAIRG